MLQQNTNGVSWPFDPATDWTDGQQVKVSLTVADKADLEPLPTNPPGKTNVIRATPGVGHVRLWWNRIYDDSVTKFQVSWRKASEQQARSGATSRAATRTRRSTG